MENASDWAAGVAARLKLIQVDGADSSPATRQEYFAEELGRALKGVPAEKRGPYLDALADWFPAWGSTGEATTESGREVAAPMGAPEEWVERLVQAAPELDAERRQGLVRKLAGAGLAERLAGRGEWRVPEGLEKELGLAEGQGMSPENALRLLGWLAREFNTLETLTWETWARLAPRSGVKREEDLRSAASRFLAGETVEGVRVQQGLEKTRKVLAGLLAGIALGGKEFAEEYVVRFLPKNIEDVVHSRGVSIFGESMEKKCWTKYKELAYTDAGTIEKKIRDTIAKEAEEVARKG